MKKYLMKMIETKMIKFWCLIQVDLFYKMKVLFKSNFIFTKCKSQVKPNKYCENVIISLISFSFNYNIAIVIYIYKTF